MSNGPPSTRQRYDAVVAALMGAPGVTVGSANATTSRRGFGATALQVDARIFAMLSSGGAFVVKLPRARVDELVAGGDGERFDPGHGRLMKEWLAVSPASGQDWLSLAAEAMAFVRSAR